MAGIYIHIPYCRRACHYCDFHFSTNLKTKDRMAEALCREMQLRKNELPGVRFDTLYFGGGTPSLLEEGDFRQLFETIAQVFNIDPGRAEATLEANPDDLSSEKLDLLRDVGFNRLSIGVQSFNDDILQYLNRIHSAQSAKDCIQEARVAGFENITIDLMYGIPGLSTEQWKADLGEAFAAGPEHISAYCLTIEPETVFGRRLRSGKMLPADEDAAADQFITMVDYLVSEGYEHYEISNFARPGYRSKHNSAYWTGVPYLGIGPGAHSYDGRSRSYNVSNNPAYIRSVSEGILPSKKENLTAAEAANDYLLTSIRTVWGCDLSKLKTEYGLLPDISVIETLVAEGLAELKNNVLTLTLRGKLLADTITEKLMV